MNPFEARDIWPAGTVIDRKYVIDATLGRGSFGTAYRCHHRVLARTYVIKRLHSQFAEDENYVQKFIQEARAVERLRGNPQIVEIYDMTQTEDGHLILVMENMVGGDLEALIRRVGRFEIKDAIWYALKIAEGLAAAHAAGLVHRDVKPENVLLGADPREAKLTDFGIVADRDVASPTSVLRGGSIGYAAPEQWHLAGKYLDGRSDLYALGVTLYRMLTGDMPFPEVEIGQWIERVRTTRATPVRAFRQEAPEALERLTEELLSPDRDQRPASAVSVIERLKALTPGPPPVPEARPARKTEDLAAAQMPPRVPSPVPPPPSPPPIPSSAVPPPYPPRTSSPPPSPVPQYAATPPPSQIQQPYPSAHFQAPQYQPQPQYQQAPYPSAHYQSPLPQPMPLPLPPPPIYPVQKSSRAGLWVGSLILLGLIGAGGWWFINNRPPKKNERDGLTYVWIPAGKFRMGCDDSDCRADEKPQHEVTLTKGFYLSQTETTVEAYRRFLSSSGGTMPGEPSWGTKSMNPGWQSARSPMVEVSWNDANRFCEWVGGRLPSEAEWEYAAHAGTSGVRYGDINRIAWFADNSGTTRIDSTNVLNADGNNYENRIMTNGAGFHPVGLKAPNPFGLYDMVGNVWEWVGDYYDEKYYANSPSEDPHGPGEGTQHIGRGASYYMYPRRTTATARSPQKADYHNPGFGFRCAWDAPLF